MNTRAMEHDRLGGSLRIFAIAAWAGIILAAFLHRDDFTLDGILSYTPESPLLAFAALMGLFALKSLTVVFYAGALYAAGGVLFPLPVAILVNLCGTLVMALIPYFLARRLGAARADELRQKYPKLREFERIRSRNSFAFVVVLRCINIINFDVGSMYCGAARLPLRAFLTGSLVGKLVDLVMWSVMGATLDDRNPVPFLIALVIDLTIALTVVLWSKKQNQKEEQDL